MRDNISNQRIQLLHPKIRQAAIDACNEADAALTGRAILRIAYTLRTFAEQAALYLQKPKVTNAKAGYSYHNYGLALDIVLLVDKDGNGTYESASWQTDVDFDGDGKKDWLEVVAIFKNYGFYWGGDFKNFKDYPHFEMPLGYKVSQLLALHNAGKTLDGYVQI